MDDEEVIVEIRERVTNGQYEVDFEHIDYHVGTEGFTLDDVEYVVGAGAIIKAARERNRWLFCGKVSGFRQNARFLGQWLHVSVEREGDAEVTVVTAYRPDTARWRTERRRR